MFFCVSFFLRVLESLTRTCVLSKNKSLFFLDAIKWVRKTSFMFCRTPPLDWEWRQPFGFTKLNGNRPKRKIDGLKRLFGSIRALFDWNKGKRTDWTQPSQQPPPFQFRATKHIHIHVCVCLYLVLSRSGEGLLYWIREGKHRWQWWCDPKRKKNCCCLYLKIWKTC